MGPSTDKNNEHKEAQLDGQGPHNQHACAQRVHMQGLSLRKHRHNSKDHKEASPEAGRPLHGHSAHFVCHATQQPEPALGKQVCAQQRRRRGGRRGNTRRPAHKVSYEVHMAVALHKDLTEIKEAPPEMCMKTDVKEAHSTRRIMKDTDCAKAQGVWRTMVRTSHGILGKTAHKHWCK